MKIYKRQSAVESDIKNGVLAIEGDVRFECHIRIDACIVVTAGNITARNITAGDISAWDITAGNITARNITAGDITAGNITAGDISAWDITAWDITAENITAENISYYAFCSVYQKIKCQSIVARRGKSNPPVCLDGKLELIPKVDEGVEKAIALLKSKGLVKDGIILVGIDKGVGG
jgi:cytoskeletal protein CcmA (bactofilin family)